jgi:hydroxyacyl-ACP dehydratase HTD2-like protein with hotdog domain
MTVPSTPTEQVWFEDVSIGDELPVLEVEPSRVQMFFFSAATYNGHRIHYDTTWAVDVEGYPDLLIQGPMQVALMSRALTDWVGGAGRLVSFSVQNRGSAFVGDRLRFRGQVTDARIVDGAGRVELSVRGEKADGTVLMPGTATVRLPLRAAA